MNILIILAIASGGALGAVSRHLTNILFANAGMGLPWATLTVNIIGSFIMGLTISYLAHFDNNISQEVKALITTGFLGALTTFSTFSLDALSLMQKGEYIYAGLYILASVVTCLLSVLGGMIVMRVFA